MQMMCILKVTIFPFAVLTRRIGKKMAYITFKGKVTMHSQLQDEVKF